MKKMAGVVAVLAVLFFSGQVWAAATPSSMVVTPYSIAGNNLFCLKVVATAKDDDGTFANKTITAAEAGFDYHKSGLVLVDAWAVNDATTYPNQAAVVTITDATTRQLVGATAGDTLTLSTSASGVAYLSIDRGSTQRSVTSLLTVAIADTRSDAASAITTIYLVFKKVT